jgi:hypothetical protein
MLEGLIGHGVIASMEEANHKTAQKAYKLKFEEELKKRQEAKAQGEQGGDDDEDEEEEEEQDGDIEEIIDGDAA